MLFTLWQLLQILGALLLLLFLGHLYMSRKYNYWRKKGVPQLNPKPFFGNFIDLCLLRSSVGEILKNIYDSAKDKPLIGFYIFDEPFLLVKCPELAKEIFVKNFANFCDRSIAVNHQSDPIASNMMFNLRGTEWKVARSKVTPFFTSGNLKQMFHLMNDLGKGMSTYIGENCCDQSSVDPKHITTKYTTDLIASTAFGIGANCIDDDDADFLKVSKKLVEFPFIRGVQILTYFFAHKLVIPLRMKFFDPEAIGYFKKALWHSIDEREKHYSKKNDLIDIFVRIKREKISDFGNDKITGQAALIYLAGFEPMSATIAYGLYELCFCPDVQNKLRREIQMVMKRNDGKLTYDGLKEMEYLDMVVSEILRKYPMLSFIGRTCVQPYKIPDTNITIDKGTSVYFTLYGIQMDGKYFPDPDRFDPERFSKDNKKDIVPYTYVPFGIGPHGCIGERFGLLGAKIGLAHILSEFEVMPAHNTPKTLKFVPTAFILVSDVGLPIRFKRCQKL